MRSKKVFRILSLATLAFGIALPAFGQAPGQQQPDEVDQLAQMVGLSEEQQSDIRAVIDEISPQVEELQVKAQTAQQELYEMAGPDADEEQIREDAAKLGVLSGEITAMTLILQSRVAGIFTKEQRDQLDEMQRQQQQMQRQMQQQQMQQQFEQQMRQQQEQQSVE